MMSTMIVTIIVYPFPRHEQSCIEGQYHRYVHIVPPFLVFMLRSVILHLTLKPNGYPVLT